MMSVHNFSFRVNCLPQSQRVINAGSMPLVEWKIEDNQIPAANSNLAQKYFTPVKYFRQLWPCIKTMSLDTLLSRGDQLLRDLGKVDFWLRGVPGRGTAFCPRGSPGGRGASGRPRVRAGCQRRGSPRPPQSARLQRQMANCLRDSRHPDRTADPDPWKRLLGEGRLGPFDHRLLYQYDPG